MQDNIVMADELRRPNCIRNGPPPCRATCRRWCCPVGRSTTWKCRTSCGERSTVRCPGTSPSCWSSGPGGCAGTSAGTPADTRRNSSWPRSARAQWSSPSRSPRSRPSAGNGSTAFLSIARHSPVPANWTALTATACRIPFAPPGTGSAQNTRTRVTQSSYYFCWFYIRFLFLWV